MRNLRKLCPEKALYFVLWLYNKLFLAAMFVLKTKLLTRMTQEVNMELSSSCQVSAGVSSVSRCVVHAASGFVYPLSYKLKPRNYQVFKNTFQAFMCHKIEIW